MSMDLRQLFSAPNAVTIVPNNLWVDEINRQALETGTNAVILESLAYTPRDFLQKFGDPISPVISRSMQKTVIRHLLKDIKTAYFKNISPAVVNILLNAVIKLKRNRIMPPELGQILSTRGGHREYDLLLTYRAYENELNRRGWFDEENLYHARGLKKPGRPVFIIGFDIKEPWMDLCSASWIPPPLPHGGHGASAGMTPAKPEVFALHSPKDEASFIAEQINAALKNGVYPKDISVYANAADAMWIARAFQKWPQQNLAGSNIVAQISNNLKFPAAAPVHAFIELTGASLRDVSADFEKWPAQTARTLFYAEKIRQVLAAIDFEYNQLAPSTAEGIAPSANITRTEFLAVLHDELDAMPPQYDLLPFKLVSLENAGIYDDAVSIIPFMNKGIVPQSETHTTFFSEPDTLSPSPDLRIEELFPDYDSNIKTALKHFKSAHAAKTVITYHLYAADGREAVPSPFIIKYCSRGSHSCESRNPEYINRTPAYYRGDDTSKNAPFTSAKALSTLKKYLENHIFSPSQLELFGKCPFAYFCKYILGVEPPEDKTPDVQQHDRGTLIHEALEVFLRTYSKEYLESFEASATLVGKVVDDAFKNNREITEKYHPDMVAHLKERVTALVIAVLKREHDFLKNVPQRPTRFEFEFNGLFTNDVPIKGRIDRIDEDSETFTVIDYKSGRIPPVISGIENGTHMQIPIYIEMARRELKKRPVAGFLYSIKGQKRASGMALKEFKKHALGEKTRSGLLVEQNEWDRLVSHAAETAREYVKKIRAGIFNEAPKKCPDYCDWKDVCKHGTLD